MTAPKGPGPVPKLPHERFADRGHAVKQASTIGATGRPSVVRSGLGGAGAGAATGAAVGGVPGAVIGAGVGAVGGASKAHAAKRSAAIARLGGGRQMLVGEFVVCMVIVALSPLTDKHKDDSSQDFLKRMAAVCALFFVLGLIGSAGKGPTKVAAGLGGLVTLSLLLSDRDVFAAIAAKVSTSTGTAAADPGSADGNQDVTGQSDAAATGQDNAGGPLGNGIR